MALLAVALPAVAQDSKDWPQFRGRTPKRLADNTLEANRGVFNSTPAISGNRLLLRSNKALYCLAEK